MREDLREAVYDKQLCAGPWQARMVKLADVYDNLCDAPDAATVKKMLPKAERAIALAGEDERLQPAVENLRALAKQMERKWNL